MKNKFAALIMATFVATPVMAQNVDNQVFANQNVKAIELSQTEMQETQGEIAPMAIGAGIGAGLNAATYAYGAWKGHHQWNTKNFAKDVAAGAAIGAVTSGAAFIASGGRGIVASLKHPVANVWRAEGALLNHHVHKNTRPSR